MAEKAVRSTRGASKEKFLQGVNKEPQGWWTRPDAQLQPNQGGESKGSLPSSPRDSSSMRLARTLYSQVTSHLVPYNLPTRISRVLPRATRDSGRERPSLDPNKHLDRDEESGFLLQGLTSLSFASSLNNEDPQPLQQLLSMFLPSPLLLPLL